MITICNQHQTLVQLNKRGNYKMPWKIVDALPQEKKFCVHAMISELSWRQIIAQIFCVSCSVSIQTQTPLLSDKMIMQSICRWPIESCQNMKRSWSWTFFSSWSGITLDIAFWYWSVSVRRSSPQKWKCACDKVTKKRFAFEYEFSLNPILHLNSKLCIMCMI